MFSLNFLWSSAQVLVIANDNMYVQSNIFDIVLSSLSSTVVRRSWNSSLNIDMHDMSILFSASSINTYILYNTVQYLAT